MLRFPFSPGEAVMLGISKLQNPIRNYPWGSRTVLSSLLGAPTPSPEPEAELWMGAHPQAPSEICVDGCWTPLTEVIRTDPVAILGPAVAARYGATLPFLFKVLAVEEPLSIQAHPDPDQAVAGCRREDALGIPRDAAERCYRDAFHKPELLYPLTPFWLLHGFRPIDEMLVLMDRVGWSALLPEANALRERPAAAGLERFFATFMGLGGERGGELLAATLERAGQPAGAGDAFGDVFDWILRLAERFPGDHGALAPLLLNLRKLRPGEAVFTDSGILHAYLSGVGVELMVSSDNVLRGGLTSKHRDVAELLRILRFEPDVPPALEPIAGVGGERRFETTADEFSLAVLELDAERPYTRSGDRGVEILLVTEGAGELRESASSAAIAFEKGDSFLIPAAVTGYRIVGSATLFRAQVTR
ncbi:MAG: mannose-6-phosphate isomerase, class I [bacterium]|nr:mannose-6-phosphate isomerase, class I [bacterium]